MRLDTYAAIWEILPYYGTLDKIFRLMRRLNNKTSQIWMDNMAVISENVNRKKIAFSYSTDKIIKTALLCNPFIHLLHKLSFFVIDCKKKYEWFMNMIESISNPHMIDTKVAFSLSPKRDTNVSLLNFERYIKNSDLTFLDLYQQSVEKVMKLKIDIFEWIYSAVFIEELSNLKEIAYFSHIIFPWSANRSVETFIKTWKEVQSFDFQYKQLIIAWTDMDATEVAKLINHLPRDNISLITNKRICDVIEAVPHFYRKNASRIFVLIHDNDAYLLWSKNLNCKSGLIYLKDWLANWK